MKFSILSAVIHGCAAQQVLNISIFSPLLDSTAGIEGKSWLVDFSIGLNDVSQSWPSLALGSPAISAPVTNNSDFGVGQSSFAPGLVVLCNTTVSMDGTPFQGANTNLAGLHQLNAVSQSSSSGNITEAWFAWFAGAAMFGSDEPSLLTVYVLNTEAPDYINLIPTSDSDSVSLLSNVATREFIVSGNSTAESSNGTSSTPPTISINTPGSGERVGLNGSDFVIDLVLIDETGSGALSDYSPRYQDAFTNPDFGPGANSATPSLVVLCSTTIENGVFQGPTQNLAGLFQIVTRSTIGGQTLINAVWQAGFPVCGQGINSTVTAFLVEGDAPDIVEDLDSAVQGTTIAVEFQLSGDRLSTSGGNGTSNGTSSDSDSDSGSSGSGTSSSGGSGGSSGTSSGTNGGSDSDSSDSSDSNDTSESSAAAINSASVSLAAVLLMLSVGISL